MKEVIIKEYDVYGFTFGNKEEALEFESNHIFVWDDWDEGYMALSKNDVEKYSKVFKDDFKGICQKYQNLANSNSMGSLYPLAVIKHVFEVNKTDLGLVWEI